jgi:hypothetical protein
VPGIAPSRSIQAMIPLISDRSSHDLYPKESFVTAELSKPVRRAVLDAA